MVKVQRHYDVIISCGCRSKDEKIVTHKHRHASENVKSLKSSYVCKEYSGVLPSNITFRIHFPI